MIVIEHLVTGEKYNYPSVPINKETAEGFTQTTYIPKGYKLSEDQTPVDQTKTTLVEPELDLYVETTNYPVT